MLRLGLLLLANWGAWRGPTGIGVTSEADLPTRWSRTENVRWRMELPEPGNSTPIVWGDRVFLTQPLKAQNRRTLMCFDRKTGKLLWQNGLTWTEPEPTHATNPYASASPATDGSVVVAWFGSAGLAAYDFRGKQLWHRDLGIQRHTWGYGTSPVLAGNRVFLNFGPGERAFLIALDKRTGKTLWQVDTPKGEGQKFSNWTPQDMYGSWSTPLALKDLLIVSWPHQLTAFDQATGKILWANDGLGDLVYPSPVHANGIIVAMGGFSGPSVAVRDRKLLWRLPKSRQMIGSGVIHNGYLYVVDNGGIAECLELETGKVVWTQRLRGSGQDNGVWSSPVLAGSKIYVMNKSGETFIFQASPTFELLGSNALNEPSNSSVVPTEGELFLRTHQALWCISARK
jgi:outer membrane protein assembly factor BamB